MMTLLVINLRIVRLDDLNTGMGLLEAFPQVRAGSKAADEKDCLGTGLPSTRETHTKRRTLISEALVTPSSIRLIFTELTWSFTSPRMLSIRGLKIFIKDDLFQHIGISK